MVSLEQIQLLEKKVEQALKKIIELQGINATLESENEDLKTEIDLLKEQCERFEKDEEKIEQSILSVLDKLNSVEDSVRQTQTTSDSSQENDVISPATHYPSPLEDNDYKEQVKENTAEDNNDTNTVDSFSSIDDPLAGIDEEPNESSSYTNSSDSAQSSQLDIY